jgi:hypothetical protein
MMFVTRIASSLRNLFPPENRFHAAGCIVPAAGFVSGIVPVWQGNGHTPSFRFLSATAGRAKPPRNMTKAPATVNLMCPSVASRTDLLKREKRNKLVALARHQPYIDQQPGGCV